MGTLGHRNFTRLERLPNPNPNLNLNPNPNPNPNLNPNPNPNPKTSNFTGTLPIQFSGRSIVQFHLAKMEPIRLEYRLDFTIVSDM